MIYKSNFNVTSEKTYNTHVPDSDTSSLVIYLREINKIPLLAREEEVELAQEIRKGSKEAKEKLINANLRFVVSVARKYQNQGLSLDDLISEGNIGLITAVDKFDVDRGYHFISYAVWWIRQSILKALYEKSRMIRLPFNKTNGLMQIEKAKREIYRTKGGPATIEEIADYLGIDEKRIADLINISKSTESLDTPISMNEDDGTIIDYMENNNMDHPDHIMLVRHIQDEIRNVLSTLSEKESAIIKYRFGLECEKPHTLKEIGEKYHLTKERIRQIQNKAINRLRSSTRRQILETFVKY